LNGQPIVPQPRLSPYGRGIEHQKPADWLSPEAPTIVAVVWDGIAQNVIRRPAIIRVRWRIARSSVVA
jgi:hypothetical protein